MLATTYSTIDVGVTTAVGFIGDVITIFSRGLGGICISISTVFDRAERVRGISPLFTYSTL